MNMDPQSIDEGFFADMKFPTDVPAGDDLTKDKGGYPSQGYIAKCRLLSSIRLLTQTRITL